MAVRKSIRSAARARRASRQTKQGPQSPSGTQDPSLRPTKGLTARPWSSDSPHYGLLVALENHRLRLKLVYGVLRTIELALRKQGAEQDEEIADCLKEVAQWTLGNQIAFARDLVQQFGGWPPSPGGSREEVQK